MGKIKFEGIVMQIDNNQVGIKSDVMSSGGTCI